MGARGLTVLFFPESAYGPTNNCIGIGDVLRQRGHRVVFAAESSWKGRLRPFGFEEELVDLEPPAAGGGSQAPGQFWKDYVAQRAPEFRRSTFEQLTTVTADIYATLIDGAQYVEPQLKEIIARVRPDVIVEDNVVLFPALATAGVPLVRIASCNPLEVPGVDVPPIFSGYPSNDRSRWRIFREEFERTHRALWERFDRWVRSQGAGPLPYLRFMPEADVNLYLYPEIADYVDRREMNPNWIRLESSVRRTDEPFEIPEKIAKGEGSLVYFSLGSLGSADVELMQRLIDMLEHTVHRYIVSMGPRHEELRLPDNMWGAEFLPQTTILPLVDLVITHGGNNTVTESFHFGKPMVVLPLFWDQYDNAQRVHELGFGQRLDTYRVTFRELHEAMERLLGNAWMRQHLREIGAEIRERNGLELAADHIEKVGIR
ncbi:glycosyltransferase [Marinactinospora thermotolerans]|uniref:Glycosyltransferase, MGT family n=1 Tax=Marinactinospora thermotolerans DSM 45154 TaxID=1122192 RepID=A0A1T4N9X0_9ACTN|nr:nucleotide disphospho-sugar-binding domain-containing protein [Marinactinospora thermotolerans]SJZ75863.1 glycosyltransferase, MGT family [Marinactinospora thermotolerans DSM 45154]